MGGILTHIIAGLASGFVVYYLLKFSFIQSFAIFIGNALPDILKFGISALKQGTLNIAKVEHDSLFRTLSALTSSYTNWFALGFFFLLGILALYHYRYLKKSDMEEYASLYVFILIGAITHLVLDVLVKEAGIWI